jgi:hypothetical protein
MNPNEPINQNVEISFSGDDKLTKVVTNLTDKISAFQLKVTVANVALGAFNKVTNSNILAIDNLSKGIGNLDKVLNKTVTAQAFLKIGSQLADGISSVNKQLSNFELGLKTMAASGYSSQILDDFSELGNIITFNTQALEAFSLQALSAYNRFAKAKSEVAVLFAPGDEFVTNLSKNIQQLVNGELKNAVTSIDALSASYQAASALFLEASENQAVMVSGLKLSKAGGADASATMQVLTQTIRAYSLSASDADKVSAALNETIKLGITSLPELAQGFAQTAVVAKEAGIKLEELSASVAALTLKGSSTPAALTGIEALSRVIINKTPEAVKALRDLKDEAGKPIKFDVNEIKTKGFAVALNDLNKAVGGNASALADIIPESLAYSTALGLMADNAKQLTDNTAQIKNVISTGSAAKKALDEVFGIKLNNQAETFESIINRITEQFIQLGEQLAPFFEVGVKAVEEFSKVLSSISPEMKAVIAQVIIGQLAFGNMLGIFQTIATTVLNITGTYIGWRAIMLLFNGELKTQYTLIKELASSGAGIIPIFKQILGIDQSRLLVEKGLNSTYLNSSEIIEKLKEQNAGFFTILKQRLGIDQSRLVNLEAQNITEEEQLRLIEQHVSQNRVYKKELEKITEIEKELNNANEKKNKVLNSTTESLQKISIVEGELKEIRDSGLTDAENLLKYQEKQNELNDLNNKYSVQRLDLDKQNNEITQIESKLLDQKNTAETLNTSLKERTLAITKASIEAERLSKEALEAKIIADMASAQAIEARSVANFAGGNSSRLNAEAIAAESLATSLSNKATVSNNASIAANVTLKGLQKKASLEQAVAEGRLAIVNTALGKGYIINNGLLKLFYTNVGVTLPSFYGIATGATVGFGAITTATFTTIGAVGQAVFTGLKTAIMSTYAAIAPFLAPLAPLLLALVPIVLVLHDQFAGTGAQVRQLNEKLDETARVLNQDITKEYQKIIDSGKVLTKQQNERLTALELESIQLEKQESIWDVIIGNIGGGLKNIWNFVTGIVDGFLKLFAIDLGKWWDTFNYDRIQSNLDKLDKTIENTQNRNLELIKSNQQALKGLSNDDEVNKAIKNGTAITVEMQTRLKTEFELMKKTSEATIKANEDNLKELNEQLKDYDKALSDHRKNMSKEEAEAYKKMSAEQRKAYDEKFLLEKTSSGDQAKARKRSQLESINEKTKKDLAQTIEDNKIIESVRNDRNQMLKTLEENSQEISSKSTTLASDIGANAMQTKLNKSLRSSKEDLEKYSKFVLANVDGTNRVIVDGVERDLNVVTDLGDKSREQLRTKYTQYLSDVNEAYEAGNITAEQATQKIKEQIQLQTTGANGQSKNLADLILSSKEYLDVLKQQNEYSKKAAEDNIARMQDQSTLYKKMMESKVVNTEYAISQIRKLEADQLDEQIKSTQTQLDLAITEGTKGNIEKLTRSLNILNETKKANTAKNAADEKNDLLKLESSKNNSLLQLNQEYISSRLGNQVKLSKQMRDLEIKQLENTKQQLINELEEYKKIPGVRAEELQKMQDQINIISAKSEGLRIKNTVENKNAEIKLTEDKNNDLIRLNQLYFSSRIGNQESFLKTIGKLELEQIKNSRTMLNNELVELSKNKNADKEAVAKIQRQITELNLQESVKRIEITNKEIEFRTKKQNDLLDKEIAVLKLSKEKSNISEEDYIKLSENTQKRIINNKQKEIQEKIILAKKNKQDTIELEKQLVDTQLSFQQLITASLEREYQKRSRTISLNTEEQVQNYNKIINTLSNTTDSLQEEQKIIESRNSLMRSQLEYEENKLQLQLRTTSDIVERAKLETKSQELKNKNLIESQRIENESFLVQQKMIDLGLQRQQIELNIKQIQNDSARQLLEIELEKAELEKKSELEIKSIKLKIAANKEETKSLKANQTLLDITKENQKEIAANSKKELEYKQEIARSGGALDVQLAKENEQLSVYDKQATALKFQANIQQNIADQRIKTIDIINKAESYRLDILNKQLNIESNSQSSLQKQFSALSSLSTKEKEKQKIAEMAAKSELESLGRKQNIEKQILEMQIRQNKTALERQKIEQQVAVIRLTSELKIAEAENMKVQADKTKTKEEKEASNSTVDAKRFALKAQQYEEFILKQKEADSAIDEQIQRSNLAESQRSDKLDKTLAYVSSTKTKRDDKELYRNLKNDLSRDLNSGSAYVDYSVAYRNPNPNIQLGNLNIPSFTDFLKQNQPSNTPNVKVQSQPLNFDNSLTNNNNNINTNVEDKDKKNIIINFTNTNDIKVTSDNPTKELAQKLQESTINTMYEVFRKVNTDLGNN